MDIVGSITLVVLAHVVLILPWFLVGSIDDTKCLRVERM